MKALCNLLGGLGNDARYWFSVEDEISRFASGEKARTGTTIKATESVSRGEKKSHEYSFTSRKHLYGNQWGHSLFQASP